MIPSAVLTYNGGVMTASDRPTRRSAAPEARHASATDSRPIVIGWRENVALPLWGIDAVRTKADTGARTSAIDVANLVELKNNRVSFDVIADRRHPDRYVTVEADIVRRTRVRSSTGRASDRIVVATDIVVGTTRFTVELGLVCRKRMLCRMLLGRTALSGRFVVDPSRMYVVSRRRRRRDHGVSADHQ